MAVLHLPLTLTSSGIFERAGTEENIIGSRLRVFILSGAGEYLRLPSPGIRALWIQLYNMGITSRFRDAMREDELVPLEGTLLDEVNFWLEDIATILEVKLLGDDHTENGISFRTKTRQFIFSFIYARTGHGLQQGAVGPWNILESSNVIG
jgi:hypothetical protein